MSYNKEFFEDRLAKLNISLTDAQFDLFIKYYKLLVSWNERINLTSIVEYEDVVLKHFVDSLAILKFCDIPENARIVDIGTGAGFPGLPLKIIRPDLDLVLGDSLNKRVIFLKEVISMLGLSGIEAVHGRAEELGHEVHLRESFDYCLSRAVADLPVLCEYALPFVKSGGYFISYKSCDIDNELELSAGAVNTLASVVYRVERFTLPLSDIGRSFVIIRKEGILDNKYPRSSAKIKKKPL